MDGRGLQRDSSAGRKARRLKVYGCNCRVLGGNNVIRSIETFR